MIKVIIVQVPIGSTAIGHNKTGPTITCNVKDQKGNVICGTDCVKYREAPAAYDGCIVPILIPNSSSKLTVIKSLS